jgi:hypothetical protein
MCAFSGNTTVVVSNTRIFAKTSGRLATIVYSMTLTVDSHVAMLLPLPVLQGGMGERALSFVNLEGYPDFFDDLDRGWPEPTTMEAEATLGPVPCAGGRVPLAVHSVGAFEASFVPRLQDFDRLDARFRLSDDVWQKLPAYADYGFAVFRMAPGTDKSIHPMAFRFHTRFPDRTFFPTVHIHDGEVHDTAAFDHSLYYQIMSERVAFRDERASFDVASAFVHEAKNKALVSMNKLVYLKKLVGELPNRDFFVMDSAQRMADLYRN